VGQAIEPLRYRVGLDIGHRIPKRLRGLDERVWIVLRPRLSASASAAS
jgi:hypothetical protein